MSSLLLVSLIYKFASLLDIGDVNSLTAVKQKGEDLGLASHKPCRVGVTPDHEAWDKHRGDRGAIRLDQAASAIASNA